MKLPRVHGKRIDLDLESEHAVERADGHRPGHGSAVMSALIVAPRRAPPAARQDCSLPTSLPSLREGGADPAGVPFFGSGGFAFGGGLGDVVADVERQRERGIDGGAVGPRLLGEAEQGERTRRRLRHERGVAGRESAGEDGDRVAGDRFGRIGAPALGERLAVGEERRDSGRPATVDVLVLGGVDLVHARVDQRPDAARRERRRRARLRRRRAGCRSAARACRHRTPVLAPPSTRCAGR